MFNFFNNLIIFVWVSFFSSKIFANESMQNAISGFSDDKGKEALQSIGATVVDWISYAAAIVAIITIVYGGMQIASGKEEGKQKIIYAIIGIAIVLIAVPFVKAISGIK